MLYLEDYLEMIEQLPMELRERFTEMREMDLQVENSVDTLDDKVKKFFEAAKKLKPDSKQQQYETIRKDYYKLLDSADEKVQIANQVYDTVERYLRKLDQEVSRFKMELEADHAGITEILERRSLESDGSQKMQSGSAKSDKRKHTLENHVDKRVNADKLLSTIATNTAQDVASSRGSSLGGNSNSVVNSRESSSGSSSSSLPYSLDNVGSSSAIAMAAAQAVSNTLQMQQGRRTASMKASYEAIKSGGYSGLGTLGRDFTYGANASTSEGAPSSSNKSSSRHKNKKHKSSSSSSSQQLQQQLQQQQQQQQPPGGDLMMLIDPLTEQPLDETSQSSYEWTYDPNEPRYCVCNQVSYGEMVGCDNAKCPIEWFHYGCVGITNPPKGKWYCPQCAAAMKRREKKDPPSIHKTK